MSVPEQLGWGKVLQPGNDTKTLGNASKPDALVLATHTHYVSVTAVLRTVHHPNNICVALVVPVGQIIQSVTVYLHKCRLRVCQEVYIIYVRNVYRQVYTHCTHNGCSLVVPCLFINLTLQNSNSIPKRADNGVRVHAGGYTSVTHK